MLFAVCDPFCALQACFEGVPMVTIEDHVFPQTGNFSTITLGHTKKLKSNAFVRNIGHFNNEIDSLRVLGRHLSGDVFSRRNASASLPHSADEAFEGFFRTFHRFQKSAESGRQCGDDPVGGNFHAERS